MQTAKALIRLHKADLFFATKCEFPIKLPKLALQPHIVLTLLHSNDHRVLAVLSAIGLKRVSFDGSFKIVSVNTP